MSAACLRLAAMRFTGLIAMLSILGGMGFAVERHGDVVLPLKTVTGEVTIIEVAEKVPFVVTPRTQGKQDFKLSLAEGPIVFYKQKSHLEGHLNGETYCVYDLNHNEIFGDRGDLLRFEFPLNSKRLLTPKWS